MEKREVILLTLAAWLAGCGAYSYWFVTPIMALPDLASSERGFGWPAMMSLIFGLPFLLIGVLILVRVEAHASELSPRRQEGSVMRAGLLLWRV